MKHWACGFQSSGGPSFSLDAHENSTPISGACGVPDGETIILIGGNGKGTVSRWSHFLALVSKNCNFCSVLFSLEMKLFSFHFRYNISGFVESLPSGPFQKISACVGLSGHNGQVGFQNLSTAQLSQVLFSTGGHFGGPLDNVFKLTPGDDSWKLLPKRLPYSMLHSQMAVIGGRIWLVSGKDSQGKYRKEVSNLSVIYIASWVKTNHRYLNMCQLMTSGSR